jgi:hypothetical protein
MRSLYAESGKDYKYSLNEKERYYERKRDIT